MISEKKKIKKLNPPDLALWIIHRFPALLGIDDIAQHLVMLFEEVQKEKGATKARLWFWGAVLRSLPGIMSAVLYWRLTMFKNYLKISFRTMKRQKAFSVINIAGLAIGMACCILIMLWVVDEMSYDRFHANSDRIFRVISTDYAGGDVRRSAGSPSPIGPTLLEDYPEVVNFTRVQCGWSGWHLHLGEKSFTEEKLLCADPDFFEIFQFPFIKGNPKTALLDRYSIVLTETLAKKCFGDEDPMGKVVQMSNTDLTVTGVIKDVPRNSHLYFDYAFPAINMTDWRSSRLDDWKYMQFATYVQLQEDANADDVTKKIAHIVKAYEADSKIEVELQPLRNIHLHSTNMNSWIVVYPSPGNVTYVIIFSLISLLILFLACVNFINISTARAGLRAKEIGVRKVSGAFKNDLVKQFFSEALTICAFSFIIALVLAYFLLPVFNQLSGKTLSINSAQNIQPIIGLLGIVLLTGLVSGVYPALYLSTFNPVSAFKSLPQLHSIRKGTLRKILVIGQFTFTIALLIATTVIYRQLHYIQNKDLGFNQNNLILFASYGEFGENYEASKVELLQNPNILHVCRGFPPSEGFRETTNVDWAGKDPSKEIMLYSDIVDYDYLETFGLQVVEGRFYSRDYATDPENFVVNETAVKVMGMQNPIGKQIRFHDQQGTIIGVVKDYNGGSLHMPINPKILQFSEHGFFLCVRYAPNQEADVVPFLEQKWKEFVGSRPFRYEFLDESINNFYNTERRISTIIQYFTILTVIIACLGLFGLASFMAERRTKEIGIRKVLGASVLGVIVLLVKEFVKWVIIANVLAWPIAYVAMNKWLQNFAYKTSLGLSTFLFATIIALLIALATVAYHAIKASLSNPVEALRYE